MVCQKTILGSHLQSNIRFSNTPKAKRTVMQKLFSLLIALCLATAPVFVACDDDGEDDYADYSGVVVSVCTDMLTGNTYFLTDNDIRLNPLNLSYWSDLARCRRVYISFNLAGGSTDADLKPGTSHSIALSTANGACGQIYTYTRNVDVSSPEYQAAGNDSLNTKCKNLVTAFVPGTTHYVANGYFNFTPTMNFSNSSPVEMLLWYDATTDVSPNGLVLHLFYDNNTTRPDNTDALFLSLTLPQESYDLMRSQGRNDGDTVEVAIMAPVASGTIYKTYRVPIEDLITNL